MTVNDELIGMQIETALLCFNNFLDVYRDKSTVSQNGRLQGQIEHWSSQIISRSANYSVAIFDCRSSRK
jgi:hypothetical protein